MFSSPSCPTLFGYVELTLSPDPPCLADEVGTPSLGQINKNTGDDEGFLSSVDQGLEMLLSGEAYL